MRVWVRIKIRLCFFRRLRLLYFLMKAVKKINIIVFLIWVSLISFLLYRNYTGVELRKEQILSSSFKKDTYWYDIYNGKKKIGFAATSFEKAGDEIIMKHNRELTVYKQEKENMLIESLRSLNDSNYAIKSFEFSSKLKDEKGIRVTGELDKDEMIFFLESSKKRKTHKITTEGKDFYLTATIIPVLIQKGLAPNMPTNVSLLNYIGLSLDNVRVVLEEIRPVKVGINVQSLYKFRVGDSIIWSNEKGIIIKEKYPSGIMLYSQVESFAKEYDDRVFFDYTSLPYFKSNRIISDTKALDLLRLKIKGFTLDPEIYKKSNIVLDNDILIIHKAGIKELQGTTYKLPYDKSDMIDYLSPDKWVLSDYKPLEDTGRIYARAHKNDPFLLTKYLNGYLNRLIKTQPMFGLSDSKKILKSLSGDYLEKTVMFATYARAGGLPTRLVGGLVYLNGYFYFHTWPEVWLDKWIPADPAFVQFPADVTHIPLKEGTLEDLVSIVDDLRNIKIEIMEAK